MRSLGMALAALLMATSAGAGNDASGDTGHEKSTQAGTTSKEDAKQLEQAMMEGEKRMNSVEKTGHLDHDFMLTMKAHHEMALDMSKVALRQGKDSEVKAMAQKTIEMQTKDIAEIDRWLKEHPAPASRQGRVEDPKPTH